MDLLNNFNILLEYPFISISSGITLVLITYFLFPKKNTVESWESHVLPHGPLKEIPISGIKGRIWMVTGKFRPDRNMIIFKLPDGGLMIHSAIALEEKVQKQVEEIGNPKFLVVPNSLHRRDAAVYKRRYPNMKVLCPSFCIQKVREIVSVDGAVEDAKMNSVSVLIPPSQQTELTYELTVGENSKVLVFCDLLFNICLNDQKGMSWLVLKILGSGGDGIHPKVTPLMKRNIKDKEIFCRWLMDLSKRSDIKAMFVGHGNMITENCSEKLERASNLI